MTNVDKDFDGMISPTEFYHLLSQKFEKDDPEHEIKSVFDRMDENKDGILKSDELYKVSQMLGENIPPSEIKDMIKMFNRKYQKQLAEYESARKKDKSANLQPPPLPDGLDFEDFLAVMHEEL
mmetsp:Transcript_55131/g.140103  ORF Transcript_55131/g.140103 Transcript_55131/m.140103 type:complete len:123 (+) Transcript_55131:2-370(+)